VKRHHFKNRADQIVPIPVTVITQKDLDAQAMMARAINVESLPDVDYHTTNWPTVLDQPHSIITQEGK